MNAVLTVLDVVLFATLLSLAVTICLYVHRRVATGAGSRFGPADFDRGSAVESETYGERFDRAVRDDPALVYAQLKDTATRNGMAEGISFKRSVGVSEADVAELASDLRASLPESKGSTTHDH